MTRTTPARPVSVEAVFPELAAHRGRTTRLHPRPGRPGMRDSHVGGPMLWPYDEPWPVCDEPHRHETEGYPPDDIRSARAAGAWPRSRPWPGAGTPPGKDGPVPFVGLAQLFRRDVPALAAGPDSADLLQLFRCPFAHGSHLERHYRLRWRRAAETERAERFLAAPPEVPVLPWEHELPEPCVLHPEEVDAGSHSWMPLEDRDPSLRGKASIQGGPSAAQPTRLRFGRDRDLARLHLPGRPRPPAPMGALLGRSRAADLTRTCTGSGKVSDGR
ncbi:hypothetical protein [Streptomyces sp. NPDC059874]|uniref:hypothetical protein n=1 Tax=Streptomyces sp. NPDC059874 TaxID=3346983 RepID=UPI0036525C0E